MHDSAAAYANLPLTAELALKTASISGSSSIVISFFSVSSRFLASSMVSIHFLKGAPTSVWITLARYYLGSLSLSFSLPDGKAFMTAGNILAYSSIVLIVKPSN